MAPTRRRFLLSATAAGAASLVGRVVRVLKGGPAAAGVASAQSPLSHIAVTHGPFVGHLTVTTAFVWAKCARPGDYRLLVRGVEDGREFTANAEATAEGGMSVVWSVAGLEGGKRYGYEVSYLGRTVVAGQDRFFITPLPQGSATITRLAFGSCAREDPGSAAVWRRMSALDPDCVVLLGDTPYIDSTVLEVQRTRYSEFAAVPEFARLLRNKPLYATWDDHDFGRNDSDGQLEGRDDSRRAFLEYHANPSYGEGDQGVYTKFRRNGVEVFLLDTRYFAGTEPSPLAADQPTLLGRRQWEWLQEGLRASTARFKLLASGMIWNGAVRPNKQDHWATYLHEREAVFRFIGRERISGVVLVGGDIHRTRVLRHDTNDTVGYPLTELVTSPIHGGVIEEANTPHPALVHDSGEPHSFMLVTVDTTVSPATLSAQFQNSAGRELYSLTLTADTLAAA